MQMINLINLMTSGSIKLVYIQTILIADLSEQKVTFYLT